MYQWPYTLQRQPKYFWTNNKVSVTAAPCSWCWIILNSKDLQSCKCPHKYCKTLPSWIAFLSLGDFVLSSLSYLPAQSNSLNILQLRNSLLPLLPITKTTPEPIKFPNSIMSLLLAIAHQFHRFSSILWQLILTGKVHGWIYDKLTSISSSLRLILSKEISLDFLSSTYNATTSDNTIMSQEQKENIHQVLEIQY